MSSLDAWTTQFLSSHVGLEEKATTGGVMLARMRRGNLEGHTIHDSAVGDWKRQNVAMVPRVQLRCFGLFIAHDLDSFWHRDQTSVGIFSREDCRCYSRIPQHKRSSARLDAIASKHGAMLCGRSVSKMQNRISLSQLSATNQK